MARGLDHVVHAVRDLAAAAALYERLGFTVGARNRHPWGTENHIVQFDGFFVEILAIADPAKLGDDGFSRLFGTFNRDFLARGEGLSLVILESHGATSDAEQFRDAGIAASGAMTFEREGKGPDGTLKTVGFELAFARDQMPADASFAVCRQHNPESFWNPALQRHRNTVTSITGAVLVADNPTDHHIFLSAFTGERELYATSNGVSVKTPRGDIQIMDAVAYRNHFGVAPPDLSRGMRIAALRFAVGDPAAVAGALRQSGVPVSQHMGRAIVAPGDARGAAIVFESAAAGR